MTTTPLTPASGRLSGSGGGGVPATPPRPPNVARPLAPPSQTESQAVWIGYSENDEPSRSESRSNSRLSHRLESARAITASLIDGVEGHGTELTSYDRTTRADQPLGTSIDRHVQDYALADSMSDYSREVTL